MKSFGFTLQETMITMALVGSSVAVFAIAQSNAQFKVAPRWNRVVSDYVENLASQYQQVLSKTGNTPITAGTPDGLAAVLPTTEAVGTYNSTSPETFTYPSGMVVYLKPEQVAGISNPVLSGTDNREWVLLDINGATAPNSLTSTGDRVLLYIENTTGLVQTAYQKAPGTYVQSFYDLYKP